MTDCKHTKPNLTFIGIIATFTVAGVCAGFAGGQLSTRSQAATDLAAAKAIYDESSRNKNEALRMCLMLAPKAADSAAAAASAAGNAASAAQQAIRESQSQVTPDVPNQ